MSIFTTTKIVNHPRPTNPLKEIRIREPLPLHFYLLFVHVVHELLWKLHLARLQSSSYSSVFATEKESKGHNCLSVLIHKIPAFLHDSLPLIPEDWLTFKTSCPHPENLGKMLIFDDLSMQSDSECSELAKSVFCNLRNWQKKVSKLANVDVE